MTKQTKHIITWHIVALVTSAPVIFPLLHELGHIMANLLTGGHVIKFAITDIYGGYTVFEGGNSVITNASAYIAGPILAYICNKHIGLFGSVASIIFISQSVIPATIELLFGAPDFQIHPELVITVVVVVCVLFIIISELILRRMYPNR